MDAWKWFESGFGGLHDAFPPAGFFWYECKEVWIEGLRSYFLDWWNCLDVMVLSMYLASFALRVLIMLKGIFLCKDHSGAEECIYFTQTGEEMIPDHYFRIRKALDAEPLCLVLLQCVRTGIRRTPS